ncbi:hypothetical protein QJS10_CPA01g01969 [Acorus calamus]|uniref:F-box domain-containing protein n=1 Tax=Acorus calamus TaxID=4465 RepID=A0AAV9FGS0_ACOCL|nr:hypothetical protein QJS10_CPA01g01969 [Acorus calamus]
MEVDWSDLPEDMLYSIAMRMDHLSDYVRFGAVCKSWRSAIIGGNTRTTPLHLRFPFLLLSDNFTEDHALYSPLERKLHPIRLPNRLRPTRFLGSSSDGWVCMIDDNLYLLNPFSGAVVFLPPPRTSFDFVFKAVWSAAKTDPNCIIALLCEMYDRNMVYYCRPGDARWTALSSSLEFVNDVVFFNENLYVVDWEAGRVVAMDLHQGTTTMMAVEALDGFLDWMDHYMHLAAGPSGPLLVVRHMKKNVFETERFELFELDGTLKKWVETKSLDEGMLFLGWNTSIWLSSSSGLKECKGNSIYFIDMNKDLGIFYLEDGSFGSIWGLDEKPLYYNCELVVPILP